MLKTVFLPLALFIIMFGMGMTLKPVDFGRVLRQPKATLLGLLCQIVLLPLIALLLITVFGLKEEIAVGLMLIAACPGGATSNIISHLSKGDSALSVTLTAISSLITVFSIPLLMGWALNQYVGESTAIALPFVETVLKLAIIILLPIGLGMLLHKAKPALTQKMGKGFNIFSLVFLALIIVAAVAKEENLAQQFQLAGVPSLLLNLVSMAAAFGVARLAGLSAQQQVTLSIEAGIQNGTLALAIALGMLENPSIAMPAVVYSLLMFFSGGGMMAWRSRSA